MFKTLGLMLVLAASPVFAQTKAAAGGEPVIVRNDGGGNINEYRARRAELARAPEVQIRGKCFSACVIFTTLPNACLGKGLKLGFHGSRPKSGIAQVDYWLDMRMGEFLRGEARRLYETQWRHIGGQYSFHFITSREYQKLDPKIRICGEE